MHFSPRTLLVAALCALSAHGAAIPAGDVAAAQRRGTCIVLPDDRGTHCW